MNETILIIDDTPEIIRMIRNVLQNASYKTLIARGGEKGLQIAENENPDLILLDIMMPKQNGYEICKILKSNIKTLDIPVIFISALDNTFDKVLAFSAGAADYVTKPIQDDELLARINAQIKPAKYRKELQNLNKELLVTNEKLLNTIEQLNLSRKQLTESEKLASIGVLSAGIAHEINNPVHFISAGIETLKEYFASFKRVPEKYDENLILLPEQIKNEIYSLKTEIFYDEIAVEIPSIINDINTGAERIIEIIKGLGLFLHEGTENKKIANLHDIIESALVILTGKYKNKICIYKNFDQRINPFYFFAGQLNQVFVNIIGNAADAANENGNIWIKTELKQQDCEVVISIKDDGSGIPDEIASKIFDPFFTTKEVGKGTGLGLYISYEIIQKHDGKISLVSHKQEFTEFEITLPYKTA